MFPGARFIHISRHPFSIFASTIRLWQSLDFIQGFQIPRHKGLDEFVLKSLETMYDGYNRQVEEVPAEHVAHVKYEDLVAEPLAEFQRVYEELGLGDFATIEPKLTKYHSDRRNYKTNRNDLLPEDAETVRDRWAFYFEQFGYE